MTAPYFTYQHGQPLAGGCTNDTSSISGMAFYEGGDYPDEYDGALFFSDYSRGCIIVMFPGSSGLPATNMVERFVTDAAPVNLEIGPDGDLFYVDIIAGTVERVRFTEGPGNNPPTAEATADPEFGPAPLTVQFDGSGSTDPDGDALTYAWDLNGDGLFDTGDGPDRGLVAPASRTPRLGSAPSNFGFATPPRHRTSTRSPLTSATRRRQPPSHRRRRGPNSPSARR